MYTIKRAAELTGVPEASLRSWERRYGAFVPQRSESGYRLYDQEALAIISTMRRLVADGWAPQAAAEAIRTGSVLPDADDRVADGADDIGVGVPVGEDAGGTAPSSTDFTVRFVGAAARLDVAGIDACLDEVFGLGSFEHVVDSWLFPALAALGAAWARGEIDVAGEHAASYAVQRRLSAAFDAAGSRSRGPRIVVGLPPGGQHVLGAQAFATAIRRRGMDVLYLGANLPADAWGTAVTRHEARAAVMAVVTPGDRVGAVAVAQLLAGHTLAPMVCAGGAAGADLAPGVCDLASGIAAAAEQLDRLMHADT